MLGNADHVLDVALGAADLFDVWQRDDESFVRLGSAYGMLEALVEKAGLLTQLCFFRTVFNGSFDALYEQFAGKRNDPAMKKFFDYAKSMKVHIDSGHYIVRTLNGHSVGEPVEKLKSKVQERYRRQFARYSNILPEVTNKNAIILAKKEIDKIGKDQEKVKFVRDSAGKKKIVVSRENFPDYFIYFVDLYFLVGYVMEKDPQFFAGRPHKIEESKRHYLATGQAFLSYFRLPVQRSAPAAEQTGSAPAAEQSGNGPGEERQDLNAVFPVQGGEKYRIITRYDILDKLQAAMPDPDWISEADADECIRQKYFIVEQKPQYLKFVDDEGFATGAVFVKGPHDEFYIFTAEEAEEIELGTEILVERLKGVEAFTEFFVQFINRFDLDTFTNRKSEEDQQDPEDEELAWKPSEDGEIIALFEKMIG